MKSIKILITTAEISQYAGEEQNNFPFSWHLITRFPSKNFQRREQEYEKNYN